MKSKADSPGATSQDLTGYELLVGVGGGIAAYKVCHVVSRLVQRGCGVTVTMTDAATRFVGPLTFQALTARQVFTSIWPEGGYSDQQHIRLSETADLFLVAPCTADLIGKFAAGLSDDLVTTLMLGRDCPAVFAPAMNTRMWENQIVQRNLTMLKDAGMSTIEPAEGWLACRTIGQGRMAEPDTIIDQVVSQLKRSKPRK